MLEYTVVSVSVAVPRMKSPPPCQLQEQGQSPLGRWMKCLGRFKIQALTHCDANVMSTRTTAGQFKCEFKGAMEDMSGKLMGQFNGAMDESSGKGSMMQAHITSGVVMDITAFEVSHAVGADKDATALQAKKRSA